MQIVDGSLISFDPSKIKLRELILESFGEESIQDIINNNNNDMIFEHLYELQKTSIFSDLYSSILNQLSINIEEINFAYQKIVSFRVHRVKNNSVNYHNDVMYGHGEKVFNVWVPLCDTNRDNALHISDLETSKRILNKVKDEKLSIIKMNKLMRIYCTPQLLTYGQILLFNTMTMHGTEVNYSKEHRLSFDFRILPQGESPGRKNFSDFYTNYVSSKNKIITIKSCLFYLVQGDSLGRNLSHSIQRQVMKLFAKNNNLESAGLEETEISGMSHCPNLFHYIIDEKVDNIVMFSILCLPWDYEIRNEVLTEAINNKVRLYFCLEKSDNKKMSIEQINIYYRDIVETSKKLLE
jgi:ectoine hydroxylase-related dioxygenase (phytanoyl-CoA dioxygenase family)